MPAHKHAATEPDLSGDAVAFPGRRVIATIGIDRYRNWRRLGCAVHDARGVGDVFVRLGFETVTTPLLDGEATGKALWELVADDLTMLGPDDSLVLFYAGHGTTRTQVLSGGNTVKTGYLIPVDASPDRVASWIELDGWLSAVSRLPAKHIIVIIDACHSGIALGPVLRWRNVDTRYGTPLLSLNKRRSRRIITSALEDELALDSGPLPGHSLFTGCLIEGLTHGLGRVGSSITTGSELAQYVQRRVQSYPNSCQTPDFGTLAYDEHGEMIIPLLTGGSFQITPARPKSRNKRRQNARVHAKLPRPHSPVPDAARPSATPLHTILFLAANPIGTDPRALDKEARAIQQELERSGYRDCFKFETRWAAEALDLLRELRRLKPTVVHFSGHFGQVAVDGIGPTTAPLPIVTRALGADPTEPRHGVFFQGADGRPQLVPTQALEDVFDAAGASVKVVVLNACYSEAQAEALVTRVDCVVGMGGPIRDEAARNFAIGFYGGLGECESIATAYKQGRAAISLEGLRGGDAPQLKVREGVDAGKLVLAMLPDGRTS